MYGEVPDDSEYEGWGNPVRLETLGGVKGNNPDGLFEPPDCKKGDIAKVWFYMRLTHGVQIDKDDEAMFERWSKNDPVSPWEQIRSKRIANI